MFEFKKFIMGIQTFLIWDPAVLRQSSSQGTSSGLGPNGQHLSSLLAEMKVDDSQQFAKMVRKLQKFLPQLEDISFRDLHNDLKEMILHERDEQGTLKFNSQQISDGTLRLIAMAYLRYGKRPYTVVSFEEPENGVHPPILRGAVQLLKGISHLKPHLRSQVFMTTHSPHVLDMFQDQPESIFIMEKGTADSGAKLTPLKVESMDLAKLLFDNSLGNLWFSDFLVDHGGEQE